MEAILQTRLTRRTAQKLALALPAPLLVAALSDRSAGIVLAQSPTATMLIDLAVMTYYNALRVQGWMGDLALQIEHECFGQEGPTAKLRHNWGVAEGLAVENTLRRLAEQLIPLFERANQQLIRTLQALRTLRHGPPPAVAIGHAGQVNLAHQQINLSHG